MPPNVRVITLVLAGALHATSLTAQGADAPKPGGVNGAVAETKSGMPVPKATVILRGKQEPGIGTTTSASGVFAFQGLDSGTYQITVERAGYVTATESLRKTVTVKAGETTSDFRLIMTRTGVVSGRVFDTDGEPLARASIQLSSLRKGVRAVSAVTNDLGEYRAFDIAPGRYRISASYVSSAGLKMVRMQAAPGPDGHDVHDGYRTIYFPGTVDPAQSVALSVEPGSDLREIDFRMVRTPAVRVSGRVNGPTTLFASVSLQPLEKGSASETQLANTTPKGEFELSDVFPGAYWLVAVASGGDIGNLLTARRMLQVGDQDLEGLQLTLGAGQKLTGRLIAPEGRQIPSGLIVVLQSRMVNEAGGFEQVAPDGTFRLDSVAPGDYDVVIGSTGASDDDLYIASMKMGDTDALADGVHIAEGAPEPLDIVLKPNGASVVCAVEDDKGMPIPAAQVVLVPDTPKTAMLALHGECKATADGTCKISGITPGDYHVYALAEEGQVDQHDPDFLKSVMSDGKALTLTEGEQEKVRLTAKAAE